MQANHNQDNWGRRLFFASSPSFASHSLRSWSSFVLLIALVFIATTVFDATSQHPHCFALAVQQQEEGGGGGGDLHNGGGDDAEALRRRLAADEAARHALNEARQRHEERLRQQQEHEQQQQRQQQQEEAERAHRLAQEQKEAQALHRQRMQQRLNEIDAANTAGAGGSGQETSLQYSHQHRHQHGHRPPTGGGEQRDANQQQAAADAADKALPTPIASLSPAAVHEAAVMALSARYSPDPFKKVRLRIPLEIVSVHGCKEDTAGPINAGGGVGGGDSSSGAHSLNRYGTRQCMLDGLTRITIRGRGFQGTMAKGGTAWLAESGFVGNVTKPILVDGKKDASDSGADGGDGNAVPVLRIPCENLEFSFLLPDLVAFCTLPSLSVNSIMPPPPPPAHMRSRRGGAEGDAEDLSNPEVFNKKLRLARLLSKALRRGEHNTFHFQMFTKDLQQTAILRDAVGLSKKAVTAPPEPKAAKSKEDATAAEKSKQKTEEASAEEEEDTTEEDADDDVQQNSAEVLDETLQAAVKSGNWKALGIGGLDKQFSELFRRAFATRSAKSSELVSAIGIQHVKGVILHGPPGTGKTLAARMLAKLLKAKDVNIINGPELMSKYVGDSEKNIRDLFAPAMAEHKKMKDKAGLYVLVFDEVDAILRPRGTGGDESSAKALYDGVTTQLLSYMDGVDSAPNILIIGLTNRLDALDKALLRPGRFEVQIRLHLPDKTGREEILWVHTQKLRDHKYLASDVNLAAIAEDTISFSGADLAGTVRSAISYALERHAKVHQLRADEEAASKNKNGGGSDEDDACAAGGLFGATAAGKTCGGSKGRSDSDKDSFTTTSRTTDKDRLIREALGAGNEGDSPSEDGKHNAFSFRVTSADFRRAVKEILSARSSGSGLTSYMGRGVVQYSKAIGTTLRNINKMAQALLKLNGGSGSSSSSTQRSSSGLASSPRVARFAITGPRGSGKTAVAALAARNARFASSFVISPETLIGLSPTEKIKKITDVFDIATHTPSAVVLIDDCDTIIEAIGGKGNLNIVVALRARIHRDLSRVAAKEDSNDNKLLIITTSTSEEVFHHLGLYQFEGHAMLADLSRGAAANILHSYHVFGGSRTPAEVEKSKALSILAARNLPPRTAIKRLMFFIDQARAQNDIDLPSSAEDRVPLSDLTEHPLFPSLWVEEADEAEEEALLKAAEQIGIKDTAKAAREGAKKTMEDIFDPFAPDKEKNKKKGDAEEKSANEASQSYLTVPQFQSVLAQFHSFYSNTNVDFVVEDLTPV